MSKLLLHIDYTQYRRFVELYGQYYYGPRKNDPRIPEADKLLYESLIAGAR